MTRLALFTLALVLLVPQPPLDERVTALEVRLRAVEREVDALRRWQDMRVTSHKDMQTEGTHTAYVALKRRVSELEKAVEAMSK